MFKRERTERLASGQKLAEEDIQESSLQTAEDFEEKSNRELAKFMEFLNDNPETVVTDKQSTKRCLDKHLILLCHQKVGQNFTWRLPEQIVDSNDNLRNVSAVNAVYSNLTNLTNFFYYKRRQIVVWTCLENPDYK